MKTLDIVLIAGGVGLLGYLTYKNKDQFAKPLTDADNEPLRAGFDTGTNNGQGYQTESEKPASDPVVIAETVKAAIIPAKNTEFVKSDDTFHTGEPVPVAEKPTASDFFNQINKPSLPSFETPDPSPSVAIEPKIVASDFFNKPLAIPGYNTTTPREEIAPVLKPLVAEVSPSAPVVSLTDTPEQYPTLLYNNTEKHIESGTYDYGLPDRETFMYAQDF